MNRTMNKLPRAKRAQVLSMLTEGMSMRASTRVTGVSINTAAKLHLVLYLSPSVRRSRAWLIFLAIKEVARKMPQAIC